MLCWLVHPIMVHLPVLDLVEFPIKKVGTDLARRFKITPQDFLQDTNLPSPLGYLNS